MRALVVYLSQTGNTRKIAEAIFDEISCEKEIKKLEEVSNIDNYNIVFAGFPVWQFGPAEPAKKFLAEHSKGKKIALFVTHAMDKNAADEKNSARLNTIIDKCKAPAAEGDLAGFFNCQVNLHRISRIFY